MEFAASLPSELKLRGDEKKIVLREALRDWLPDQVLDGPKRGFNLPIVAEWFRGDLRGFIFDLLTDPRTTERPYFEHDRVLALLERHASGDADNSFPLWTLMMFELWHREFVDPPLAP